MTALAGSREVGKPGNRAFASDPRLWHYPAMDYQRITIIEPDKRSGKPCIRGTRMTVIDVLEYLAGGMTQEELLGEFPDLTVEISAPASRSPPTVSASSQPFRDEAPFRPESFASFSSNSS